VVAILVVVIHVAAILVVVIHAVSIAAAVIHAAKILQVVNRFATVIVCQPAVIMKPVCLVMRIRRLMNVTHLKATSAVCGSTTVFDWSNRPAFWTVGRAAEDY